MQLQDGCNTPAGNHRDLTSGRADNGVIQPSKGVFTQDQKREMIGKLTETMVGIEGEQMRQVTWVTIEEVDSGDWGIGGHCLTTQDVKDLQASPAS